MPTFQIAVGLFMLAFMAFVCGFFVRNSDAYTKSLADTRLLKIQDGNEGAYELWKATFDNYQIGSVDTDYFVGLSHALNLVGVITDDEWTSVRVATGGGE